MKSKCDQCAKLIIKGKIRLEFDGDGDDFHTIGIGVAYMANEDFQIDLSVGAGLNDEAPDFIAGIGFAYRF